MLKNLKINSPEPALFMVLALMNLYPLFTNTFLGTIDGPAHVYNSGLINSLLFQEKSILNLFFKLNSELIPNWTGHFFLSALQLIFSANVAEKLLQFIILFFIPLAFRKLVLITNSSNVAISYLIFPFVHNFPFYSGFYNFSIGILIMLYTIYYWLSTGKKSIVTASVLLILFIITFFSHLFVFGMLCMIIAIHIFYAFIKILTGPKEENYYVMLQPVFRQLIIFCFAILPGMILTYNYFETRPKSVYSTFLTANQLLDYIVNIRSLTIFKVAEEKKITHILFYIIAALLIAALISVASKLLKTKKPGIPKIKYVSFLFGKFQFLWFLSLILITFLYIILPDQNSFAALLSVRMSLLFFIFLLLWISTCPIPKWVLWTAVLTYLPFHFLLLQQRQVALDDLNLNAIELSEVGKTMLPYSVVLPFDYSGNWLKGHFSNYAGFNNHLVILDNYECETGYFPVVWNEDKLPNTLLGNLNRLNCNYTWKGNPYQLEKKIDYILIYGNIPYQKDFDRRGLTSEFKNNYRVVYTSNFIKLFKLKS